MTVLISSVRGQKSSQSLTALTGLLTIREHKSFLEEGKFIVGGGVRNVAPLYNIYGFWHHVGIL